MAAFTAAKSNYDATAASITSAQAIVDNGTNVGNGVFQIPVSAQTTLNSAIVQATEDVEDEVTTATSVLDIKGTIEEAVATYNNSELNAPDAEKLYNIVVSTAGHAKENNPIIIIPGDTGDNNPTGYMLNANLGQNDNLSQAFTFTKVEGNNYKISAKVGGEDVYLTNGNKNGSAASWKNSQIQATTDAEKAMSFKIAASSTEGSFNIYNTDTESTIACQNGGNIYTEAGNADFSVAEVSKPSFEVNTTVAGWGTLMLPFAVADLPEGVNAYTCSEINGNVLELEEVYELEANKPYLIKGAWDETLTGDAQGTALTYTDGVFTGVYADQKAPADSYVLLKKDKKLGFYKVVADHEPTVTAYHAYLTVPSGESAREAFFFGDNQTTAISALKALSEGNAEIYNTNGMRIPSLQKGMNIIKTADGAIRKIMVK